MFSLIKPSYLDFVIADFERIVIVELFVIVVLIFFVILGFLDPLSFRFTPLFYIPFQRVFMILFLFFILLIFVHITFSIPLLSPVLCMSHFVKSSVFRLIHLSNLPGSWTSCADLIFGTETIFLFICR